MFISRFGNGIVGVALPTEDSIPTRTNCFTFRSHSVARPTYPKCQYCRNHIKKIIYLIIMQRWWRMVGIASCNRTKEEEKTIAISSLDWQDFFCSPRRTCEIKLIQIVRTSDDWRLVPSDEPITSLNSKLVHNATQRNAFQETAMNFGPVFVCVAYQKPCTFALVIRNSI